MTRICFTAVAMVLVTPGPRLMAAPPPWWQEEETRILVPGETANNFAPANLGQLKHVATQAKKHFDDWLDDVDISLGFQPVGVGNYAPANLGQLKAVAEKFYRVLGERNYDIKKNLILHGYPQNWPGWQANPQNNRPWNPATPVAENYSPVNLGQLKLVFSFDLSADLDQDGLPDGWEMAHGLNPSLRDTDGNGLYDGGEDLDGDGISNREEFANGTDPADFYNGTRPPGLPAAPANVHVMVMEDGSKLVTWDDQSDNEDYFVIRDTLPNGTVVELGRVGPGQTSFFIPPPQ